MAQNTSPIFTQVPKISWTDLGSTTFVTSAVLGTGTAAYDGTSGTYLVFTADSTDGSFIQKLVFEAGGTNAAGVARIFINNGSSNLTADNNCLYMQYTLPATTAAAASATAHVEVPLNIQLPPNYRIYVALGSGSNPIGAGGWGITAIGGDY